MTPVEIDTQLNELLNKVAVLETRFANVETLLDYLLKQTVLNHDEIDKAENRITSIKSQLLDLDDLMRPYNQEFNRRPWTRAWLVTNSNGHVHNNRNCRTCFHTTQFYWLTQYSGASDVKIVTDAGEKACTVCFPDAPVDLLRRKSSIETKEQVERRELRAAKAAERAVKEITNPDGTRLRVMLDGYPETFKTERSAEIKLIDLIVSHKLHGWDSRPMAQAQIKSALAHKRGITLDELEKTISQKVIAKIKRDS